MNTIISYVSKQGSFDVPMNQYFAQFMITMTEYQNVLIGRKLFEQDMQETCMPNTNTFVLSRTHRFSGTKQVKDPADFRDGYIIGGRSTICSMLPYTQKIFLGISDLFYEYGEFFPKIDAFDLVETIPFPDDQFTIQILNKVRFSG
jgi:dihydrofolate reductase